MRSLPAATATMPQLNDDQNVPEELVGRLYRASRDAVDSLLDGFSAQQRANLAMFCYRKSHLHRTGLAIAATCDLGTLVQAWGTALGQALYAQSREPVDEDAPVSGPRSRITLARHSAFNPALFRTDDVVAP